MKKRKLVIILMGLLLLEQNFLPVASSQEDLGITLPSISSPQEKLHALELTRFHFITLKQFHSVLFSKDESKVISESEAQIINAGLNSFLTSAGRETLLLEALRQNKAVELKFSVPKVEDVYNVLDHPTKPLLYRLEPITHSVPATVEIKPFLDKPIAFEIILKKEKEQHRYEVNWAGHILIKDSTIINRKSAQY